MATTNRPVLSYWSTVAGRIKHHGGISCFSIKSITCHCEREHWKKVLFQGITRGGDLNWWIDYFSIPNTTKRAFWSSPPPHTHPFSNLSVLITLHTPFFFWKIYLIECSFRIGTPPSSNLTLSLNHLLNEKERNSKPTMRHPQLFAFWQYFSLQYGYAFSIFYFMHFLCYFLLF